MPRLSKQPINAMEAAAAPGVGECALERELRGGTLAAMSQVETPRPRGHCAVQLALISSI